MTRALTLYSWLLLAFTLGVLVGRSRCVSCRRILDFPPSYFAGAFAAMREQGWII